MREKEAMALAAGMAVAAPAAAALQHNIKGTQNGFAYAHASVRVSVRATNASVSAVSYGRFGSSGGAGVLERPGLDQSGTDSTPRTSEGMFRFFWKSQSHATHLHSPPPKKSRKIASPIIINHGLKPITSMATSLPHLH